MDFLNSSVADSPPEILRSMAAGFMERRAKFCWLPLSSRHASRTSACWIAVELLRKLLTGEILTRRAKNIVQARSFAEML